MANKMIGALVVAVSAATGGYWYFSPYVAMRSIQEAAQTRNAEAFNARVDYTKVRESMKGQMAALVTESLGRTQSGAGSLGAMLSLALVNQMVEAFVRPEVVMRAMQEGEVNPKLGGANQPTPDQNSPPKEKIEWTFERPSMDKVIARAHKPDQSAPGELPGFVFERSGFADWKVTAILLPHVQ